MSEPERAAILTSRLAKMNPFSNSTHRDDEDEQGEEISSTIVAGGGHGDHQNEPTQDQLRVSQALKSYLVDHDILSAEDAGLSNSDEPTKALQTLLDMPHINVPAYVTDRSYPLPEYFISSSHNTYLLAHQLFGTSSAEAYETALNTGSRCVEIDAWDNDENKDEPKVTHGYTLVSNISFRSVCETIRDFVDKEAVESSNKQAYQPAPILLSLENHCSAEGQLRLVQIMKEVWGDRLLSKAVRQEGDQDQIGTGSHVSLQELGSKIVVIVEHHIPGMIDESDEDDNSSSSSDEDEEEEEKQARKDYKEKKTKAHATSIIPDLAELGVYAQSVKPSDNSWYDQIELTNGPHHHLINVSESGLLSHLPLASEKIASHNSRHMMRVFPKGTRISSKNLKPVPFWGIGAQICALNWQTFNASMQINKALFSGSEGYVLKPPALRAGGNGKLSTGKRKRLCLHIAGASDVPIPEGREADDIKPYVTCMLIHPDDLDHNLPKRKTSGYKKHKLSFLHSGENPPATDPIWNDTLEWEYEDNDLVFLRILIKSDDSFSSNPVFAVAAVRVMYVVSDWRFIRMLDLKGRETNCSLLVRFQVEDI